MGLAPGYEGSEDTVVMPYRFDEHYREDVRLADGQRAVIRCLRPADRVLLEDGFGRLSVESRYLRFFAAKDHLSDAELKYLTEIDGVTHFALGAVRENPDGTFEGLGVARFIVMPERPDLAEPAITVVDDCHGLGLGTVLMSRLIEAAAERGVHWFRCHLLGENRAMRHLLLDVSDDVSFDTADDGVLTATFPVPGSRGEVPVFEAIGDSAARRILKGAAEKMLALVPSHARRGNSEVG